MKKTTRETKGTKESKKSTKDAAKVERLTLDDLKALRTNIKGGIYLGPPARCCQY